MNRWWDDDSASLSALARVDDSDVAQGVGTAVLAYHGLATGALRPLASRTLVDVDQLQRALDSVDLQPVAKALGEATKPILGAAADRYGELLACDLHERAVESTSRLVASLANQGISWPQAVGRAADVHGVPMERLGAAAKWLRTPVINPLAQWDIADRALMEYASHVGRKEAAAGEVAKAGKARERTADKEWDESEHPRAATGEFKTKQKATLSELGRSENRLAAFRQRQQAQRGRAVERNLEVVQEQDREVEQELTQDLGVAAGRSPSADSLRGGAKERVRQEAVARQQETARAAIKDTVRARARAALVKALETPPGPPPPNMDLASVDPYLEKFGGKYPGVVAEANGPRFMLLPEAVARQVIEAKGFNVSKLMDLCDPSMVRAMTFEEAQTTLFDPAVAWHLGAKPQNLVAVVWDEGQSIAFDNGDFDDPQRETPTQLALAGQYEVRESYGATTDSNGYRINDTELRWRNGRAGKPIPLLRSIHVSWKPGSFETQVRNSAEVMPDSRTEFGEYYESKFGGDDPTSRFFKADDFDENDHPRAGNGRFREKAGGGQLVRTTSLSEFRARQARQRGRRVVQNAVAQEREAVQERPQEAEATNVRPMERVREEAAEQARGQVAENARMSMKDRVRESAREAVRQRAMDRRRAALASAGTSGVWTAPSGGGFRIIDPAKIGPGQVTRGWIIDGFPDGLDSAYRYTLAGKNDSRQVFVHEDLGGFGKSSDAIDMGWAARNRIIQAKIGARVNGLRGTDRAIADTVGNPYSLQVSTVRTREGWKPVLYVPQEIKPIALFMYSADDAARLRAVSVRFDEGVEVPLSELLSQNDYSSEAISVIGDPMVRVHRPIFEDNA